VGRCWGKKKKKSFQEGKENVVAPGKNPDLGEIKNGYEKVKCEGKEKNYSQRRTGGNKKKGKRPKYSLVLRSSTESTLQEPEVKTGGNSVLVRCPKKNDPRYMEIQKDANGQKTGRGLETGGNSGKNSIKQNETRFVKTNHGRGIKRVQQEKEFCTKRTGVGEKKK